MTTPNDTAGQTETSAVTAGQTDQETGVPDEQDNNTDRPKNQDHGDEGNPNAEAARYRVQRNEARRQRDEMQQERDHAREQLTRMRQSVVDQIASAAGLPDAGLLAYEGYELDSLLANDGTVDAEKVRAAAAEVMTKHGIRKRTGLTPNPQQGHHGGPSRGSNTEQWSKAFAPSR